MSDLGRANYDGGMEAFRGGCHRVQSTGTIEDTGLPFQGLPLHVALISRRCIGRHSSTLSTSSTKSTTKALPRPRWSRCRGHSLNIVSSTRYRLQDPFELDLDVFLERHERLGLVFTSFFGLELGANYSIQLCDYAGDDLVILFSAGEEEADGVIREV